jgi:predicted tellurium resistance membrane protein TerC
MAIWALILFLMGVLAFIFNLVHIFEWFIPIWAIILMVVSLGMLTRISRKEKEAEKEKLVERIQELENLLKKGEIEKKA